MIGDDRTDIDAALRTAVVRWLAHGDDPPSTDTDALRATLGHIIDGDAALRDALAAADTRPTKRGGHTMKRTAHTDDGRDAAGRFTHGNPGGPGRPRRAVESDYLRMLTDRLTPAVWGAIVDTAIDDARAGDARAREWLARYVLGDRPPTLFALAVADAAGADADVDAEIQHVITRARTPAADRVVDDIDAQPVALLGPHIRADDV